jgi:hypothetical protein
MGTAEQNFQEMLKRLPPDQQAEWSSNLGASDTPD